MNKKEILSDLGALNKKPENVTNHLFNEYNFFDPVDNVQVKYEMLRACQVDKQKVSHVCKEFNYSREAFYVIFRKFRKHGIVGFLEDSRKKKKTIMLNQDIVKMIIQTKFDEPDISGNSLAEKINAKFGTDYKKRAIEKAVKALGLTKKNNI